MEGGYDRGLGFAVDGVQGSGFAPCGEAIVRLQAQEDSFCMGGGHGGDLEGVFKRDGEGVESDSGDLVGHVGVSGVLPSLPVTGPLPCRFVPVPRGGGG